MEPTSTSPKPILNYNHVTFRRRWENLGSSDKASLMDNLKASARADALRTGTSIDVYATELLGFQADDDQYASQHQDILLFTAYKSGDYVFHHEDWIDYHQPDNVPGS